MLHTEAFHPGQSVAVPGAHGVVLGARDVDGATLIEVDLGGPIGLYPPEQVTPVATITDEGE